MMLKGSSLRLFWSLILVLLFITISHDGFTRYIHRMKKGLHPQMQWISYVTQSGRLINVMMSKIHREGKVYHWRARRHMAEKLSNVEKFKRRYGNTEEVEAKSGPTSKE